MIPAIKRFFWDETLFVRLTRSAIYGLSVAITNGMIPATSGTKWWWVGQWLPVIALMLGAGDRNPPAPKDT